MKPISCWFPQVGCKQSSCTVEATGSLQHYNNKVQNLQIICAVLCLGCWIWGLQGGCVLVATARTLKFILNQRKIQLPAMAETGWDCRTICFTSLPAASCPWKPILMEIFLTKADLMAKRGLSSFFHTEMPGGALSYSILSSVFCLSGLSELAFCNINIKEAGAQHQQQAREWWPPLPEGSSCQIYQLQCEAASLEYTYIVL